MNWIAVKDQVPPLDKKILVHARLENLNLDYTTAVFIECFGYEMSITVIGAEDREGDDVSAHFAYRHITHWMDLPDDPLGD